MILGFFTALLPIGGVERIGRHAAAALVRTSEEKNHPYRVLSLNDPVGFHRMKVGSIGFEIQGFGRSKGRFVLSALGVVRKARMAYLGHPNLAPLGTIFRCSFRDIRYVVAVHGIDVWKRRSVLHRLGLKWADAVCCLSHFTAKKVTEKQKLDPKKVLVIPPALDPAFGPINENGEKNPIPIPRGKVFLTVARMDKSEKYKGMDTVIQAMPRVLKMVPEAFYVIVGDGDDRARLEDMAKGLGLGNHVFFAGSKKDKELAAYYEACDVFAMPSLKEGFGVVFLEAMAFGKPVIGGNHGGIPEVVRDGVTGFLVKHGDVEALGDRMLKLLLDRDLYQRMSTSAQIHVKTKYGFEHYRRGISQVLQGEVQCES